MNRHKYLRRDTQFLPSIPSAKKTLNTSFSESSLSSGSSLSSRDDFYVNYNTAEETLPRHNKRNKTSFLSLGSTMILIFLVIAIMSLVGFVFWNLYNEITNRIKSKKNEDDDEK
jgi:hypothetical protein